MHARTDPNQYAPSTSSKLGGIKTTIFTCNKSLIYCAQNFNLWRHERGKTLHFILYFTVKTNVYQNLIKLVFSLI